MQSLQQQRQNYMREQHGLTPTELVGYELSPLRNRATKTGMRSLPRQHTPTASSAKKNTNAGSSSSYGNQTKSNTNKASNKQQQSNASLNQMQVVVVVPSSSNTSTAASPILQSSIIKSYKSIPSDKSIEDDSTQVITNKNNDKIVQNSAKLLVTSSLTASNPSLLRTAVAAGGNGSQLAQSQQNTKPQQQQQSYQQLRDKQTQQFQQLKAQHLRSSSTGNFKRINKPGQPVKTEIYNGGDTNKNKNTNNNIKALLELQQQRIAQIESKQQMKEQQQQQQQIAQQFQNNKQQQKQQQKCQQSQILRDVQGSQSPKDLLDDVSISSDNEDESQEHQVWDNQLLQIRGIDCDRWLTADNKPFTLFHLYKARFGTFPTQRESIPNSQVVTMMKRFSRNKRNKNLERFPWETFDDSRQYEDETDLFTDKNCIVFTKYFQNYQQLRENKAQRIRKVEEQRDGDEQQRQVLQQESGDNNSLLLGQTQLLQQSQVQVRNPSFVLQKQTRSMSQANHVNTYQDTAGSNNYYNNAQAESMTMTNSVSQASSQSAAQMLLLQQQSNNNSSQQFRIRNISNSNHVSASASQSQLLQQQQQQYYGDNSSNSPLKSISPSKRMLTYHYQSPQPASLPPTYSPVRIQRTPTPFYNNNNPEGQQQQLQETSQQQSFSQMVDKYSNSSNSPTLSPSPLKLTHQSYSQQSEKTQFSLSPVLKAQSSSGAAAPSFKLQLINAMRSPAEKVHWTQQQEGQQPIDSQDLDAASSETLRKSYYNNNNNVKMYSNMNSNGININDSKKSSGDSPTLKAQLSSQPLQVTISPQKKKQNPSQGYYHNNNSSSSSSAAGINTSTSSGVQSNNDTTTNRVIVNMNSNSSSNNSGSKSNNSTNSVLHLRNLHQQFHQPSPFNNELTQTKKISILSLLKQ